MTVERVLGIGRTAHAVPRRGYVLSTAVEDLAADIREASHSLMGRPIEPEVRQAFGLRTSLGPTWSETEAWTAICAWIVATRTERIAVAARGSDAISWFVSTPGVVSETFDLVAADYLLKVAEDPRAGDLLPYIIDAHGPGSRLSVRKNPTTAQSRARKKKNGVFYTPSDVADFMVGSVVSEPLGPVAPTFLDPAVGTGVFLRAALNQLRAQYPDRPALELVTESLFGFDVDAFALDGAAFVLLHDVLRSQHVGEPSQAWHKIRANLAHIDSLTVTQSPLDENQVALASIFPSLGGGADFVLGNPPYAPIGSRDDIDTLHAHFETVPHSTGLVGDLYPLFVEQMIRLGTRFGSGAMVVPLSLASNSGKQFSACRSLIQRSGGTWRFAFFDREPHALFGEDVKTRNAIVLRTPSKGEGSVQTGPLRRWRGATRASLFGSIAYTRITGTITKGIPKVSGHVQSDALTAMSGATPLGTLLLNVGRTTLDQLPVADKAEVLVGPTAYNFLNIARATPLPLGRAEALSENPLHRLRALDIETASAVYALLSSSFAFWWWYVNGDGFHVNMSTLLEMPIGNITHQRPALAELGNEIWKEARRAPVRSSNRGRVTFAYPAVAQTGSRAKIDALIRSSLGLTTAFGASVDDFVATVTDARLFETPQKEERENALG